MVAKHKSFFSSRHRHNNIVNLNLACLVDNCNIEINISENSVGIYTDTRCPNNRSITDKNFRKHVVILITHHIFPFCNNIFYVVKLSVGIFYFFCKRNKFFFAFV